MINNKIEEYKNNLRLSEKKENTIKQYEGYIREFIQLCDIKQQKDITKEKLIEYKEFLQQEYKVNTINIKITILNAFMDFLGLDNTYKLKHLKKQQKTTIENVLTQTDYERLLRIADARNKERIKYIMKVLAETGIRISELQYVTLEAVKKGVAVYDNKGTVEKKAFFNKKLQKELIKYCKDNNISQGIIFASKNGNALDQAYIYKEIQYIARTSKSKKEQSTPA